MLLRPHPVNSGMTRGTSRTRSTTRRLAVVAAVGVVLPIALAACAPSGDDAGEAGGTLTILIHANTPTDQAFEDLSEKFEEANPGTTVEFTTAAGSSFPNVRNSRLTAGAVDITEGNSSGGSQPNPAYAEGLPETDWIRSLEAGRWVDLTGEPYLENFQPGVLDEVRYDGKDFAVPTGITIYTGVYYNKALFEEYGLSVPTTWDELVEVCETLQENDIDPFTLGGKDKWPAGAIVQGLIQSVYPDMAALDEGLWTGDVEFDDPKSVEIMDKLQTIFGYTESAFPGIDYATITSRFASGEAAMLIDGTWQAPAIEQADPELEFGYFPLPGSDDAEANAALGGKLEFNMAIPTNAKNPELAKKYLAFFSEPENYQEFIKTAGFIPAQDDMTVTPFLDSLTQYLPENGFQPAWDQVGTGNPQAPPTAGFAYTSVAPMGTETDMEALMEQAQQEWAASLPTGG